MAFTDLNFLSRFLPLFLIVYYLVPGRFRTWVLFGGSLLFYAMGELGMLPLLLALCMINYFFSMAIWGARRREREDRHRTLALIVGIDLGLLVLFKALNIVLGLPLPLGISFYIFKMISYQADLYLGRIDRPDAPVEIAAYFTMFPQVAQGPIMRFQKEEFAEERHKFQVKNLEEGLRYLAMGIAMKVLVADRLASLWNTVVTIGYESISTPLAWLAAFGYSMQLYLDFWGYSLMAAGIGVMLGFSFVENFRHPYAADSVGEFYRRWHCTLTSWFRDYVYIPLGGSRAGSARTIGNIAVVWLLTGFWHGGGWHFVVWGAMLGAIIIYERFVAKGLLARWRWVGRLHVWVLIPVSWVIFAIPDLKDVGVMLLKLFPVTGQWSGAMRWDFLEYLPRYGPFLLAALLLCVPKVYEWFMMRRWGWERYAQAGVMAALLWGSIFVLRMAGGNPFLYFYF